MYIFIQYMKNSVYFLILMIFLIITGCTQNIKSTQIYNKTNYIKAETTNAHISDNESIKETSDLQKIVVYEKLDKDKTVDNLLNKSQNLLIGKETEIIGILDIVKENQMCAGSCVRVTTIRGINFRYFIPLFGNIKLEDDEKLIKAFGKIIETPKGTIPTVDYSGENPSISLNVSNYDIISNLPYHSFLISNSTKYISENFGCEFSHDKNIGWTIDNNTAYLVVRWTSFPYNETSQHYIKSDQYIELYYDIYGNIAKIDDEMNGYNPCN